MRLDAFKDGKTILDQKVIIMDDLRANNPELFLANGQMDQAAFDLDIRPNFGVFVRLDQNSISFNMNKCSPLELIEAGRLLLKESVYAKQLDLIFSQLDHVICFSRDLMSLEGFRIYRRDQDDL